MASAAARDAPPLSQQQEEYTPTEQEVDALIAEALACPCVDDLKASACGKSFVDAFTCFHKSVLIPKGQDCVPITTAFTECLRQHPEAVATLKSAADEGMLVIPPGPSDSPYARDKPA